jgi:hypothetical protein
MLDQAPVAQAPTISSSAMLVELSISKWLGTAKDKEVAERAEQAAGARSGVYRATKMLLPNNAKLKAINDFAGNARNRIHYRLTMPWSDTGIRLLSTAMYFDYTREISGAEAEFNRLADDFVSDYTNSISNAAYEMGSAFDPNDYPSAEDIRKKFAFRVNYMPLPEQGDFRIDVGNEANAALREQYESFYKRAFERSMNDVWERAYKALSNMSERLEDSADGKKKVFRDTLVSNVEELIGLLDACNITEDPRMSSAKRDLERAMYGITPEALREDATLRAETKRDVDKIIANLPTLDF